MSRAAGESEFRNPAMFAAWLRNDAQKLTGRPGMQGVEQRIKLAADVIEQVMAVTHAPCQPGVCPTVDTYKRVVDQWATQEEAL